jgi:TolA-binding protein
MAFFEVGNSTKSQTDFEKASSSFEEIRGNTEASLDRRAESSFMMGECRKNLKDYAGAAFLYLETTLNFPSALKWAPKSYEQAIRCYEQSGQVEQVTMIEKQYADWQRKFLN